MKRMSVALVAVVLSLLAAGAVQAEESLESGVGRVCEAPIWTCDTRLGAPTDGCPPGYVCSCVPSCPACADCVTAVCIRDAGSVACRTACDCEPGLGCFDGRCIAGFAPVYCCDADRCPEGDPCQHRSGEMGRCDGMGTDPRCRERLAKVEKVIDRLVARGARCREHDDCVQVQTTTRCRGTCGEVVNRRAARKIERAIARLDRKVCDTYQEDGCPFATPSCAPVVPACVENRCVARPVLELPPPIDGGVTGEPLF